MSIFEEERAVANPDVRTCAGRAAKQLFDKFIEFVGVDGKDPTRERFSAYFVLGMELHDIQREVFLAMVRTQYENTVVLPEGTLVISSEVSVLVHYNGETDPETQVVTPYDVTYTAMRYDANADQRAS